MLGDEPTSALDPEMINEVLGLAKAEAEKRAMELLVRVGVASQADQVPAQLSGAQQQRVAIARSLAMRPQAIRYVIPSLISQLVVLVKETTVAYVVSYPDMLQTARVLITNYDALVSTYLVVALIYILLNYAINQLSVYVARRSGTRVVSRYSTNPA